MGLLVCLQTTAFTLHAEELPEYPGKSDSLRAGQWYRTDPASQPVKLRLDDLTTIVAARAASQGTIFAGKRMTGQHGVAGFYSPDAKLTFYVNAPETDAGAYVDYFKQMAEKGVPVTINLSMTADVTDDHPIFNPEYMAATEEVRKAIRGK
ncbi:hypothetical protein ACFL6U_01755 [Planctomycetota bacterium]